MGYARNSIKGVVFCDSRRTLNGYTLLTPVNGTATWLIDMRGRHVNHWDTHLEAGCHSELLPGGSLVYGGKTADRALPDLEGSCGAVLELDWDNRKVWEHSEPYMHDQFHRLRNGNTLIIKWVQVPETVAKMVEGGNSGTERDGVMWGDAIQEIDANGEVVWEWVAHEHLSPTEDRICPLCTRKEWTHANACAEMANGNILVSFKKTNSVAEINKRSGEIEWSWGADDLSHQHSPTELDNGNILIFDNGFHQWHFPHGYSRLVEFDPRTQSVVWTYNGSERMPQHFYSSAMSNCQRLPNGNTLACEAVSGRILEVTERGELVWEFVNNLPSYGAATVTAKSLPVFGAFRYGMDYSGLKRDSRGAEERQAAPGTATAGAEERTSAAMEEEVTARLLRLGY